jgi:hypothetical protein
MTDAAAEGVGASAPLVEGYEALREEVVSGARGRSLGLALFVREGMSTWMRACSTWMPPPARPSRPREGATVPVGLREPMAALLADMVLAATREIAS